MLVLSRLREEAIMIGDEVEIRVLDIRGDRVRLGLIAPPEVSIYRKEIYLAIQKENMEAARAKSDGADEAVRLLQRGSRALPTPRRKAWPSTRVTPQPQGGE